MNNLAKKALEIAQKRGKVTKNTSYEEWCKSIASEVIELSCAIIVFDRNRELADIIINCL
ncbi:hypothetical protein FACS189434_09240 [Bacteroidia bacterium]|nr:hypothetical protein FACS189434_09240 [Bacteroidia bacterium]